MPRALGHSLKPPPSWLQWVRHEPVRVQPGVPSSNLPTLVARVLARSLLRGACRCGVCSWRPRRSRRPADLPANPCQTPLFEAIKVPRSVRVWAVSAMYRIPVAAYTSPRWEDPGHGRAEVARGQKQNPATTPPTQRIRTGVRALGSGHWIQEGQPAEQAVALDPLLLAVTGAAQGGFQVPPASPIPPR